MVQICVYKLIYQANHSFVCYASI